MDLSTMTLDQLKALAYDQIVLLNQVQANIAAIQVEIQKREKAEAQIAPPMKAETVPENGKVPA